MSIFENGYLKSEFINPNYRGLVGWPCEFKCGGKSEILATYLTCMGSSFRIWTGGFNSNIEKDDILITQFTPSDIPVGDLVWHGFKPSDIFQDGGWVGESEDGNSWVLGVYGNFGDDEVVDYAVPYLIAETAEDAERLKDWWK